MESRMILRVSKDKAAYLYQLLEAYEGMANYSTLTEDKHLPYRDIGLYPAPDFAAQMEEVLVHLQKSVPFERLD